MYLQPARTHAWRSEGSIVVYSFFGDLRVALEGLPFGTEGEQLSCTVYQPRRSESAADLSAGGAQVLEGEEPQVSPWVLHWDHSVGS